MRGPEAQGEVDVVPAGHAVAERTPRLVDDGQLDPLRRSRRTRGRRRRRRDLGDRPDPAGSRGAVGIAAAGGSGSVANAPAAPSRTPVLAVPVEPLAGLAAEPAGLDQPLLDAPTGGSAARELERLVDRPRRGEVDVDAR